MAFKVGDRVRLLDDRDGDCAERGLVIGQLVTIAEVDSSYLPYRIVLSGTEDDGFWLYADQVGPADLPQETPTQEKTHDYMLGYADGYRHPAGETPYDRSDSSDYRAGFVAGWDQSVAEDRADMLASI